MYDEYFDTRLEGDENPATRPEVREKLSKRISDLHDSDDSPYDQEWKKKVANEGEENGMWGYEYTDEQLEQMSQRMQGREPTIEGENHPWYKHGRSEQNIPFGDNWQRKRREAIAESDNQCERCGVSDEELREDSRMGLTVHHDVPRRVVFHHPFLSIEKHANELSNLTVLCRSCHNIREQKERGNFRWSLEYRLGSY